MGWPSFRDPAHLGMVAAVYPDPVVTGYCVPAGGFPRAPDGVAGC